MPRRTSRARFTLRGVVARFRAVLRPLALGIAAFGIATTGPGCAAEPPTHLVVVVIDTLRADRVGAYGNPRGLTPFIDSLAERGVLFRRATSSSSWTIPSVATLFTSRHASQHRVVSFESVLDASEVTLGERLHEAGWVTGGFTANFRLTRKHGYAQGFAHWVDDPSLGKIRAPALHEQALSWLTKARRARPEAPVLLYVQYMEPHTPYEPPKRFRTRFAKPEDHDEVPELLNRAVVDFHWEKLDPARTERVQALYDGEVAAADEALATLFGALEQRGLLDDAYVVVTSDHGEEFNEHGSFLHGRALYEESIRVPLVIVPPKRVRHLQGVVVDADVSLIDVAPTLLELLGQPPEPRFEGRSLLPLIAGDVPGGDVRVELPQMDERDARLHSAGLIRGPLKLLLDPAGNGALYDLSADPAEQQADPPRHADARDRLMAEVARQAEALAARVVEDPETRPLDDETRERLKALGYVAD